jgi:hypothetical protein
MTSSEFLSMIDKNFDDCVASELDKKCREALKDQKQITDEKEYRSVKNAIEIRILELIEDNFPPGVVPKIDMFRDIRKILARKYSYMYEKDPSVIIDGVTLKLFNSRGTGGMSGVEGMPFVMQQRYRRRRDQSIGRYQTPQLTKPEDVKSEKVNRKRKKNVYGADQLKYHVLSSKSKEEFIAALEEINDPTEREQLFAHNRDILQEILRNSLFVFDDLPQFFENDGHIRTHFEWVTNRSIVENIHEQMDRQMNYLKLVLEKLAPNKEFYCNMESANVKTAEMDGCITPQHVTLLRELNLLYHKTRSGFLRYEDEEECNSPHIVVTEDFHFSIHVSLPERNLHCC